MDKAEAKREARRRNSRELNLWHLRNALKRRGFTAKEIGESPELYSMMKEIILTERAQKELVTTINKKLNEK